MVPRKARGIACGRFSCVGSWGKPRPTHTNAFCEQETEDGFRAKYCCSPVHYCGWYNTRPYACRRHRLERMYIPRALGEVNVALFVHRMMGRTSILGSNPFTTFYTVRRRNQNPIVYSALYFVSWVEQYQLLGAPFSNSGSRYYKKECVCHVMWTIPCSDAVHFHQG